MTYFTSDQHFGHFSIIRLCHCPMLSYPQVRRGFMVDINDLGAFRRRP